jgi:hypothetical protein
MLGEGMPGLAVSGPPPDYAGRRIWPASQMKPTREWTLEMLANMRMHLQKPRAPWSKAGRRRHASFQVRLG